MKTVYYIYHHLLFALEALVVCLLFTMGILTLSAFLPIWVVIPFFWVTISLLFYCEQEDYLEKKRYYPSLLRPTARY